MNSLDKVEIFLLELGSFTQAARDRNLSPGSVSTRISELEMNWGSGSSTARPAS